MATTALRIHRFRKIRWLYLAGFLAYLHLNFVLYINSSFIASIIGEKFVGVVYIIAAVASLVAVIGASRVLREIGNYRALVIVTCLEMAILLGIATTDDPYLLLILDVLLLAFEPALFYCLDIFLENYTHPDPGEKDATGGVRGLYLGIANSAFVVAPLFMGAVVGLGENFRSVYFVSIFLLIPFLAILALKFRRFVDPPYYVIGTRDLIRTIRSLAKNRDLAGVFASQFILRLYYAWWIVYLPIYLHEHIGFSWPVLGVIFAATQIPYVLFEIPLGRLADRYLGEKEVMIIGFIIVAAGFAATSVSPIASILIWSSLLYFANVGGSFVEVTTESYFFKKVDGRSAHMIGLFRIIQPAATIVGVFFGSALLFFIPLRYIFIVFGALLLLGIVFSSMIRDTR